MKREDILNIVLAIFCIFALVGCVPAYSAKTVARLVFPDGRVLEYESNKEHEGLDAQLTKDGAFRVRTEKSGTNEASIAAAMQTNLKAMQLLEAALRSAQKAPVPTP